MLSIIEIGWRYARVVQKYVDGTLNLKAVHCNLIIQQCLVPCMTLSQTIFKTVLYLIFAIKKK